MLLYTIVNEISNVVYIVPADHFMISGIQPIPFYHNILMKNMVYYF